MALEVPGDVLSRLASDVEIERHVAPAGLRWSDPARWHLTVAFLGEVEDTRLRELSERLGRAATRRRAPTLRVDGAGRFDGRVLWVRVVEDDTTAGRLEGLAASVSAAARRTGIAQEKRPYRPHLTLARAPQPVDLRPVVAALARTRSHPWTADRMHLVSSRLGPRPEHTTIRSFTLRGQG